MATWYTIDQHKMAFSLQENLEWQQGGGRNGDVEAMLAALGKSKELAVQELRVKDGELREAKAEIFLLKQQLQVSSALFLLFKILETIS